MSDFAKKVGHALELVASELDHIRDRIVNGNKPIIESLGRIEAMMVDNIRRQEYLERDFEELKRSHGAQISELRKAAQNGLAVKK